MYWPKWLCESDNATLCPVRMMGTMGIVGYHALLGFMLGHQHAALSMADLGTYMQQMSTAGVAFGVGIGAKSVMKGDAQ